MKKTYLYILALGALALTSCNDYLDKLPDDRAEVNSVEKIEELLVSAYPNHSIDFMMEYSCDNVTDNGTSYTCQPDQDKVYRWEQVETTGNDDPKYVWQNHYTVAATANEALDGVAKVGETSETLPLKAEALLCRAYAMFQMANCFCMAYDPEKADQYLGVPYPKESGVSVDERGTLAETYANINADIEAALPYVDDAHLSTPKYHFNVKAAYAFAARFNLYYHNYDKAIEYASKVLGNDPSAVLRSSVYTYSGLAGSSNIGDAYIQSSENANLMLVTAYSVMGRAASSSYYMRYAHNRTITQYETFWAAMPWAVGNSSSNNTLYESHLLYGNNYTILYPKMMEQFEYTDKVNGTGYAHIVDAVFTGDETLLVRAEAYAMTKQYDKAVADIQLWVNAHCEEARGKATRPTLTVDNINTFMDAVSYAPIEPASAAQHGFKKELHPQGFTVEDGTQKNLILLILQMRRLETWRQGLRFQDIKRYGIEFTHPVDGEQTLTFKAGDLRGAIQLPIDVVDAGLEENPRE